MVSLENPCFLFSISFIDIRYYFIPTARAKRKYVGKNAQRVTQLYNPDENVKRFICGEKTFTGSLKVKHKITIWPPNSTLDLDMYPK